MKLIHLSDLHMVAPGGRVHGLDPRANLDAAVADINAHHGDAALCIATGDLTHDGTPAAYAALAEALEPLHVPWRLLPGNHDDREALAARFPDVQRDAHGFIQGRVPLEGRRLLLLDTLEPGTHAGSYCERRRQWLDAELAAAAEAGEPVYLFLHHPPLDVGMPALDAMRLLDAEPLGDLLTAHGNVRHVFFGHLHRPVAGSWRGIPFTGMRSTTFQMALDMVTADRIAKCYEAPAYGVVLLDDARTVVHLHPIPGAHPPVL